MRRSFSSSDLTRCDKAADSRTDASGASVVRMGADCFPEHHDGVIPVCSRALEELVEQNRRLTRRARRCTTCFDGKVPPAISLSKYLQRIVKYAPCSTACFVLAFVYIDRISQKNEDFVVTPLNVHRLLLVSVMMAAKNFEDRYYNNAYYAIVGGIPVTELNVLEVTFLQLIEFELIVSSTLYGQYEGYLRKHANVTDSPPPADVSSPLLASIAICQDAELRRTRRQRAASDTPPSPRREHNSRRNHSEQTPRASERRESSPRAIPNASRHPLPHLQSPPTRDIPARVSSDTDDDVVCTCEDSSSDDETPRTSTTTRARTQSTAIRDAVRQLVTDAVREQNLSPALVDKASELVGVVLAAEQSNRDGSGSPVEVVCKLLVNDPATGLSPALIDRAAALSISA